MPEARVLFGEVAGPCSLWLIPDRGAMGDLKGVRKVVKLEEKLATLCCEEEQDLTIGKVVAVRHESMMVRARVEGIDVDHKVRLFLLDWGVTRVRSAREAMRIPESVRLPKHCLARRVNLSSGDAVGNEQLLRELVEECASGKLSNQTILPGGDVTGVLTVKLSICSALARRYFYNCISVKFYCSFFNCLSTAGILLFCKVLTSPRCVLTPFCQQHLNTALLHQKLLRKMDQEAPVLIWVLLRRQENMERQTLLSLWKCARIQPLAGHFIWLALMEKTCKSLQSRTSQNPSWQVYQVQPSGNQMMMMAVKLTATMGV